MPIRNEAQFIGNLTANPEGRTVQGGKEETRVLNFSLGVNSRRDKDDVVYPDFEIWGKAAEVIENHCVKGDRLLVWGEFKTDAWDDEKSGQRRYRNKFRVTDFELLKVKKWSDADAKQAAAPDADEAESTPPKAARNSKPATRRRPDPEPEADEVEGDIPF